MMELGDVRQRNGGVHRHEVRGDGRPQFVPVLKATLKDKENLAEWRRRSQETVQGSSRFSTLCSTRLAWRPTCFQASTGVPGLQR